MNRKNTGNFGERLAAEAYAKDGYSVLARNYRTRLGEVDLILQKGDLLVFAEVKTRAAGAVISGREAVDLPKQRRLIKAARQYLAQLPSEPFVRFDVVEVVLKPTGENRITRIENAFEA